MKTRRIHILFAILVLLAASCRKDEIVIAPPGPTNPSTGQEKPKEPVTSQDKPGRGVFPGTLQTLARVYIETPGQVGITSKHNWVWPCSIRILGDENSILFESDSLRIKGRGNSTWYNFPKKPYALKLNRQADLFGTGKSKRYVLLANWMDRTLLRNDVAFEAARRTSLDWTPSGTFVELYLNGRHQGNYWLGEKVDVEDSKFSADFLFSFDTSDNSETDFYTPFGYRPNTKEKGLPVEVKYPDRDNYEINAFQNVLSQAKDKLAVLGNAIQSRQYGDILDLDSFCDWYLVHELTWNLEPNHPKSCYIHVRDGKFIAGPVWDFDWYTFIPGETGLGISNSLYYGDLLADPVFKAHLKERWKALRPGFATLGDYIDSQAARIQASVETDKRLWPCSSTVNGDESLPFTSAVNRLKQALEKRIENLDQVMERL